MVLPSHATRPRRQLLVHLSQAVETLALRKAPVSLAVRLAGSLDGNLKVRFFEVNNREFTHFENISKALNRVDKGTYGRCVFCGGRIEAEVLVNTPWVTECLECGDHEPQP